VIDSDQQGVGRGFANVGNECRDLVLARIVAAEKNDATCRRVRKAHSILVCQHGARDIKHDLAAYRERGVLVAHGCWSFFKWIVIQSAFPWLVKLIDRVYP
jgi:hypothetical protein